MTRIMRLCSAALLTLAGISSFANGIAARYGVPIAPEYGVTRPPVEEPGDKTQVTIHGTVTAEEGKQSIKDIKVSVANTKVTTTTDENGAYSITVPMSEGQKVQLVIVDIDGAANGGKFASKTVDVTLNTTNESKDDDADQTKDIALAKKQSEK